MPRYSLSLDHSAAEMVRNAFFTHVKAKISTHMFPKAQEGFNLGAWAINTATVLILATVQRRVIGRGSFAESLLTTLPLNASQSHYA